ncbi:MAG: AI-2E family transporter [Planctomycetes bacterium]|nr:AI-2E family transporter [Planctomycetota bacterium]
MVAPPHARKTGASFFDWFPWEKLTIWGLFLLLVYALREFFTVIFLTFLFSYIMTNVVRRILRILSPGKERLWLHRVCVAVSFVLLLSALTGIVLFLKKPFEEQVDSLKIQFRTFDPKTLFNDVIRSTIGTWQFDRKYLSTPAGRAQLQQDFEEFRQKKSQSTAVKEFDEFKAALEKDFEAWVKGREEKARWEELIQSGQEVAELEKWVRGSKAAEIYQKDKARYDEEWAKEYIKAFGENPGEGLFENGDNPPLKKLEENKEEYERKRSQTILKKITIEELKSSRKNELQEQFKLHLGELAFMELLQSGKTDELFKVFYESPTRPRKAKDPSYTFEKYIAMREARKKSIEEFNRTQMGDLDPAEQEKNIRASFEREEKDRLAKLALEQWKFLEVEKVQKYAEDLVPQVAGYLGQWTIYLFKFTLWFALSLLLSFFITFDLPIIRKGIQSLEQSRVREFYLEIAPGLAAFGALIGRAFQAQGVIALCNTLLTFALIKVLNIRYEVFLCSLVFLCSFIPILGVVLSTVPISLVALQYNGFGTALLSIGGVLIIHFIETSILNPKILGEMMHLHPVLVLGILVVGEHFFKVWGLLLGVPVMVYIIRYVILGEESIFPARVTRAVARIAGAAPAAIKAPVPSDPSRKEAIPVGADETKVG